MIKVEPEVAAASTGDDPRDLHVMPNYGAEHDSSVECWCSPWLDWTAPNGGRVWVHREDN